MPRNWPDLFLGKGCAPTPKQKRRDLSASPQERVNSFWEQVSAFYFGSNTESMD